MKTLVERLVDGEHLAEAEAEALLMTLVASSSSAIRAGAILTALRAKGETPEEVRGFANGMRKLAVPAELPGAESAVDIVGTGGDRSGSFNLSTGAALLTAACGQPVVKHGNRSVSSSSGSADVLEALGYSIPEDAAEARESLASHGFTFLFAPAFHPAMKRMAPIRQDLKMRTIFNILGPLTNPAQPPYAVIGAFGLDVARLMADALAGMPITRAFVVHGAEGWDEATPVGPFHLFDVAPGRVTSSVIDPADFDLPRCSPADLAGGDARHNAMHLTRALEGEPGPHRNALALGAGLALEVSGQVPSLAAGITFAQSRIEDDSAGHLLADFRRDRARRISGGRKGA